VISVVIPISNQSMRLKKSLQHLLAQQDANFEIILIDDASTDDSLQLARSILDGRPGTQILSHKKSLGLWHTRREGISLARGSMLLFLDPREWLEPGTLKRLSDTMLSFNVDMVQMKRQRYVHNVPLKINDHPEAQYWQVYSDDEYRRLTRFVGVGSCITPFCGDKLYRTDLLREAADIDFNGRWGEAQVLNINYLRLARSLILTDFAGINADWVHNYFTFQFSRLDDYKRLHTLKSCLCADRESVDRELLDCLHHHIHELLGELAWTPEAVSYFMGRELENPLWRQAGLTENIDELIAGAHTSLRRRRLKAILKRLVR